MKKSKNNYPNRKPHCQGKSMMKWEKTAALHASTRHGPKDSRKQTVFICCRTCGHRVSHTQQETTSAHTETRPLEYPLLLSRVSCGHRIHFIYTEWLTISHFVKYCYNYLRRFTSVGLSNYFKIFLIHSIVKISYRFTFL